MDVCYYNSQIKEELEGATAYINRAISCKHEHPEWAAIFAKMSDAELEHATNLVKIFEDDYKNETAGMNPVPTIYSGIRSSLLSMYTEYSSKVKYLHQIYQST